MGAGFCTLDLERPGETREEVSAENLPKGREIFFDDLAQLITHGHSPSEAHAARLELTDVTYSDYIEVGQNIQTY